MCRFQPPQTSNISFPFVLYVLLVKTDLHKKYLFPSGAANNLCDCREWRRIVFHAARTGCTSAPPAGFSLGRNVGMSAGRSGMESAPGQSSSVAWPRMRWSLPGGRMRADPVLETGPERCWGAREMLDWQELKAGHKAQSPGPELGSQPLYPRKWSRTEGRIRNMRDEGEINIQLPVELLFWADGISWGTCGRSSVAAFKVQVLSPETCSVPQRLCASVNPFGTSCQIGPCGSCGCTHYPWNTPEALWGGWDASGSVPVPLFGDWPGISSKMPPCSPATTKPTSTPAMWRGKACRSRNVHQVWDKCLEEYLL